MSSPCTTKTFTSISSSLYYFGVYDMIFFNNNNRRALNFELLLHFAKPTPTLGNREFICLTFKYRESVAGVLVVPFYFLPQRGIFFCICSFFYTTLRGFNTPSCCSNQGLPLCVAVVVKSQCTKYIIDNSKEETKSVWS